jgi:hypothetical protein
VSSSSALLFIKNLIIVTMSELGDLFGKLETKEKLLTVLNGLNIKTFNDLKSVASDAEIAAQIAALVFPETEETKGTVQLNIERAKIRCAIKDAGAAPQGGSSLAMLEELCMKKYGVLPSANLKPSPSLLKVLKEDVTAYKQLKLGDAGSLEDCQREAREGVDGEVHWIRSDKSSRGPRTFSELVCTVAPWALAVELLSQSSVGLGALEYICRYYYAYFFFTSICPQVSKTLPRGGRWPCHRL